MAPSPGFQADRPAFELETFHDFVEIFFDPFDCAQGRLKM